MVVEIGDLKLAAGRWLQRGSDVGHVLVIKIEAGHGVIGGWHRRLFDDGAHAAVRSEVDHTITAGIAHPIAEDNRARLAAPPPAATWRQTLTVKDVVAEHQCRALAGDESRGRSERPAANPSGLGCTA